MGTGTALAVDPDVVTCTLAPRYEAVRTARDFARTTLQQWGLSDLFDDVALVASELVTNALRHAIGDPTAAELRSSPVVGGGGARHLFPSQPGPEQCLDSRLPIRISLVHRSPQLVCAVSDPSSDGPVTREADWVAESGRGLHLVDSFSRSWGWHPLAGAGKVVWALFEADEAVDGPAGHSLDLSAPGRHRRSA
ncbi:MULTISPECIES: ATP-binding protein [unclassified Kitasatospora]|uniref:ATP-binding protein n=1 Tax=unclassified Kitasatospora TaxID=2633591 RepID=UPI002476DA8D|nr:ATP-binding protein [Kitasatospora sp. MAP12-44]